MRHLDLFSGIGGFALAARNVGWETVGFCEIDPYCQKVLTKNFPGVPIHDDIKTYTGTDADVITGGFPCQDISYAGKGAGIEGERSGLWTELARVIGEVRPRYAVLENVSALLGRGMERVTGDLAEIGYDAEWRIIRGFDVGVPQARARIFIVATPTRISFEPILHQDTINAKSYKSRMDGAGRGFSHIDNKDSRTSALSLLGNQRRPEIPDRERSGTNDRLSSGVDRYRGLGNAIVPQVAQVIFEAINDV